MKKVNIVGVPEHFNLPWHMALEDSAFLNRGIDLNWTDVPEGTGKMSELLQTGEADLAVILTEGIIKSISAGNTVRIVQEYVASPLVWGIHVGAKSSYTSMQELSEAPSAISRLGSGSHLMSYVNAEKNGWNPHTIDFKTINNLDGAVDYLSKFPDTYFLWEYFTTKPLVDSGVFKLIDRIPTPWPCFVIAANTNWLAHNGSILQHVLEVINTYTKEFKKIPSINRTIAVRYNQEIEDVDTWLSITKWGQEQLSELTLQNVQKRLDALQLLEQLLPPKEILYST